MEVISTIQEVHGLAHWERENSGARFQTSSILHSRAREPQLLSPHATTTEPRAPRAHALQQEKPLQWEARAQQWRVAPARHNLRKPVRSNKNPTQPKTNNKIKKFIKKKSSSINCLKEEIAQYRHKFPHFCEGMPQYPIAHSQEVKKEFSVQSLWLKSTEHLQNHTGTLLQFLPLRRLVTWLHQLTAKPQTKTQKLRPYPIKY